MSEIEGTINFAYDLKTANLAEAAWSDEVLGGIAQLSAWRSILYTLELIGQNTGRYGGFAYGNLSMRIEDSERFIVTASQTSGATKLYVNHLVLIEETNIARFWVEATGLEPPSSETITHAMIYQGEPRARFVFHVHSNEIWKHREALRLPQTPAEVAYGSEAMAEAVVQLLEQHQIRPLIFATAGHEDGIFALGYHAQECGSLLVSTLARARSIAQS